jgi:peptidoglycan/xylan/chitin deacetylase (PgdA/CDA1 family)
MKRFVVLLTVWAMGLAGLLGSLVLPAASAAVPASAAVIARDSAGTLWLYPGNGTGGFQPRRQIGSGWNGMTALVTPGDVSGDTYADVIARDSAGALWLYPGNSAGGLGARRQIGAGWQTMTIASATDMNGDGRPDLLARDSAGVLWLYPLVGNGVFAPRTKIGNGWNGYTILGPGDFSGDGRADILARDAAGRLWLYRGNGSGGVAAGTLVVSGWSGMTAIVTPGNWDGLLGNDLLTRDAAGRLWLYPGNNASGFGLQRQIGTVWQNMTFIGGFSTAAAVLGPVTNVAGVPTSSSIALSWTNPAGASLAGVMIRRALGATAPASATAGQLVTDAAAPASSFTDTGLAAGTQYSYAFFAHDGTPVYAAAANLTSTTTQPASTNLIANPSFETAVDSTTPAGWFNGSYGSNTSTFSYLPTGHTGSHSVEVQTTQYTSGAANWYFGQVPVSGNKTYQFITWYKSNVDTEVDADVTMGDGTVQYFRLGGAFANTNWTQFKATFTPPAGAKSVVIYQFLANVGYIISDDESLAEYTPVPYNRGIVSVTFDDGWANQYQNANPVLKQLGIKATYYIHSGVINSTGSMTSAQVIDLFTNGNEIGSHSVTHPDMTTLTAAQVNAEMANSQTALQNLIGAPVTDFAYPYGAYNGNTITIGQKYYASQRSVNSGYNTKDSLDVTQLQIKEVESNVTQAQVQGWIDSAIAQHVWLILLYHEVATTPVAPDDALYTTQPADFTAEMNYLKNSGVATETVRQALAEVQAQ